jgi:ATP-dependent protease HslVU (ClpYQ) peptidase subunit
MTICIAAHRDGLTVIGTDSWASNDGDGRNQGGKFLNVKLDDFEFAFAGSYRWAQVAEDVILTKHPFKDGVDYWAAKKFANEWVLACDRLPHGNWEKEEAANIGTDIIIASRDLIITITGQGEVFENEDYSCIGNEREGNMSMRLLYNNRRKKLETIVHDAIENVCSFLDGCGGKIHIRTV